MKRNSGTKRTYKPTNKAAPKKKEEAKAPIIINFSKGITRSKMGRGSQ